MGVADFLLADTPAGDDPELVRSAPRNVVPPAALLFDGATKDFPLDADGLLRESHPVDQRVAMALLVVQGTLAGTPDLGSTLRSIQHLDPLKINAQVSDAVRTSLARELSAKNISLDRIDVELPNRNSLLVRVRYQNLRLFPRVTQTRTFAVPLA